MYWLIPTIITVACFGFWTYMWSTSDNYEDPEGMFPVLNIMFFAIAFGISAVSWIVYGLISWIL